jgi:hypothetical protein
MTLDEMQEKTRDSFEYRKRLFPPLCGDGNDLPMLPNSNICTKCGMESLVEQCSMNPCRHALGYVMQRLRVMTRCTACGNYDVYRLAWMKIFNGKYVDEDKEIWNEPPVKKTADELAHENKKKKPAKKKTE